jgi:DNA polymerase-1
MMAERWVLIDGSALIYRAFHALPAQLRTAAGLPTNAVYGFALMFRKILAGRAPDRGAVVFDPPGPTFRAERYPAYKAQRPRMPEELRAQLASIDAVVAAHAFPALRVEGFEADDVIGTLTRRALEAGHEVHIIAPDKDFLQLIGPRVRMIDTMRDVTYDEEVVRKRRGVPPSQFVDLLALVGDKVDNIPGVPGIGQKGAAALLAEHGDLDTILAHVEALEGRAKRALEAHGDSARLSRELATIDQRVPLTITDDALRVPPVDTARVNALYRELEFWSLLDSESARTNDTPPSGQPPSSRPGSPAMASSRSSRSSTRPARSPAPGSARPSRGPARRRATSPPPSAESPSRRGSPRTRPSSSTTRATPSPCGRARA